jgi:hypothetical protein
MENAIDLTHPAATEHTFDLIEVEDNIARVSFLGMKNCFAVNHSQHRAS